MAALVVLSSKAVGHILPTKAVKLYVGSESDPWFGMFAVTVVSTVTMLTAIDRNVFQVQLQHKAAGTT